jgi:hypothetical protein
MECCAHHAYHIILTCNFQQAYEEYHMLPAQSNKDIADYTIQNLFNILPRFLAGSFFRRLLISSFDEPVRIAMMSVFFCLRRTRQSDRP